MCPAGSNWEFLLKAGVGLEGGGVVGNEFNLCVLHRLPGATGTCYSSNLIWGQLQHVKAPGMEIYRFLLLQASLPFASTCSWKPQCANSLHKAVLGSPQAQSHDQELCLD